MRLDGKTAIVTGGASGFGAGIARKFLAEGAKVMIADINGAAAAQMAAELGSNAVAQEVDVSDGASVNAMAEAALAGFGQLDILVNNAGVTHAADFLDLREEDFDRVMRVNLKSMFLCSQAAARDMVKRQCGCIINAITDHGYFPTFRLDVFYLS